MKKFVSKNEKYACVNETNEYLITISNKNVIKIWKIQIK